uniref:Uncharacterized protein n=1 Tax=viral metagenome TaxID=1070528 RepID=A0A6M3X7B6_9ZZZZ
MDPLAGLASGGKLTPEQSIRFVELAINVCRCPRCGKFLPFMPHLRWLLVPRLRLSWPQYLYQYLSQLAVISAHRLRCGPHPCPARIMKFRPAEKNLRKL